MENQTTSPHLPDIDLDATLEPRAPVRSRSGLRTAVLAFLAALGISIGAYAALDAPSGPVTDSSRTGDSTLLGATRERAGVVPSGSEIGSPTGPVVLVIKGAPSPNAGTDLQLDTTMLEQLPTWSYTADDSEATGRAVKFSGPLLRDVLSVAGIDAETFTTLHTVALNDYKVDIPVADAFTYPVLLATRADGRTMSVADYGPTRVVYPTETYNLSKATYYARWIWQLTSVTAE